MQDWNSLFIYQDGILLSRSSGKPVSSIHKGYNQVSSKISATFDSSASKKVNLFYRCDKIIFEMHMGIEIYAPNLKHLDGNHLNDRIENLYLPELDLHPLSNKEFKQFVSKPGLSYSERLSTTTFSVSFGSLSREVAFYTKFALGRKSIVRGHPRVELKNLNWIISGRNIPKGFQLNQIDGDFRRCDIDNLELVPVGTPLPPMLGMHADWFVKNGILYHRTARRSSLNNRGRMWVDYSDENPLITYSSIMPSLTELDPFDHCQRGLFPYPFSVTPISATRAITSKNLIEHLEHGAELEIHHTSSGIMDVFYKELGLFNQIPLEL
jgi:hypothetical protein